MCTNYSVFVGRRQRKISQTRTQRLLFFFYLPEEFFKEQRRGNGTRKSVAYVYKLIRPSPPPGGGAEFRKRALYLLRDVEYHERSKAAGITHLGHGNALSSELDCMNFCLLESDGARGLFVFRTLLGVLGVGIREAVEVWGWGLCRDLGD